MGFRRINMQEMLWKNDEKMKLLLCYRYISLIVASIFYLYEESNYNYILKLKILATLFIASTILTYLYQRNKNSQKDILILLIVEAIANIILIIPTGLLNSPYLWYSLNTLLISAILIDVKICITNVFFYIGSIYLSNYILQKLEFISIDIDILSSSINYILSLTLNVTLIILLSIYLRKTIWENKLLAKANTDLKKADDINKEMTKYIMELQGALNMLTISDNIDQISNYMVEISKKLLDAESTCFYSRVNNRIVHASSSDILEILKDKISNNGNNITKMDIETLMDNNVLVISVKTNIKYYGDLMVYKANHERVYKYDSIRIIQELCCMAFDRLTYLKDSKELIIAKEQHRIAGEIHDNALQQLFGLSCNMYGLISSNNIDNETNEVLKSYRTTINSVMKVIRSTIYDMSWCNNTNRSSLKNKIDKYIDNYVDVKIDFKLKGSEQSLDIKTYSSIYRIVSEGISNGVRHGQAQNIDILIDLRDNEYIVSIDDDGTGYDVEKNYTGLGLKNINQLVKNLNGHIDIVSDKESGTKLTINIPIRQYDEGGNQSESIIS